MSDDEMIPSGKKNGNGAAMTRSSMQLATPPAPSLGMLQRWLLGHDDAGRLRCAYVVLAYQTSDSAAEEKSPIQLDGWSVDPELELDARRARYREIAECAWNLANETMQTAKIPHVFKVVRKTDDDRQAGMKLFKLEPSIGGALESWDDQQPNERGGVASMLRVFNTGSLMLFQQMLAYSRLEIERQAMDRTEIEKLREAREKSLHEREELLDRRLEREIKYEYEKQNLHMRGMAFDAIGKGVGALIARHMPVPEHVREFILALEKDPGELEAVIRAMKPENQRRALGMINAFAEQEQRELAKREQEAKRADEERAKQDELAKKNGGAR